MIDISQQMLKMARTIDLFAGRCYSYYPRKVLPKKPFMVLNLVGHNPQLILDGEEVIVLLSYEVVTYFPSQSELLGGIEALTDKYSTLHIEQTGISTEYDANLEMYGATVSFQVVVDKRGITYTERLA